MRYTKLSITRNTNPTKSETPREFPISITTLFTTILTTLCVEDGVLNEFEMMCHLRIMFPLHFFVFNQTVSHLASESNVEEVFSRAGQLSEVNSDPDDLAVMVSIMINKNTYNPSVKDIMNKYYEMLVECEREPSLTFIQITQSVIY
jgi:hypothetical protein